MSKITADHLSRAAYVYIRQSTASQVQHNIESQRRQYKLEHRARALGWQQVIIVDEDLGRSGGGVIRPGFERLVRAVGSGEVGAVFAVEASRLARNGRDWHTLLEFSSIVGTLIIDEDEVYDPRREIDQMVLGLKGQFSVMESSAIHRRAHEALGQMAERGELFINVAPGYVVGVEGRLVKDPDLRVREAIALVFQRFREQASARQAMLTLRADAIAMPMMACVSGRRQITWKLPTYSWMLGVLANPIYAGAYAWGRAGREIRLKDGRRVHCTVRRPREKWQVLLHDQHEGYIDWDEYERNQTIIANNQQQAGECAQGAVRQGTALLAGLLYCGHCHGRLMVDYNKNRNGPAYYTTTPRHEKGGIPGTCVRVNSRHVDGPRWPRSKPTAIATVTGAGRPNWRWRRRATGPGWRGGSTTPSIPTTGWWRANWSGAGTSSWRTCSVWRRSLRLKPRRHPPPASPRKNGSGCWRWAGTCPRPGTIRPPRSRSRSASCAR